MNDIGLHGYVVFHIVYSGQLELLLQIKDFTRG
jgi:hypothetical protein